VALVDHDDVIEALASQGADQPLGDGVRPRRPHGSEDSLDPEPVRPRWEIRAVDAIPIAHQELDLGTHSARRKGSVGTRASAVDTAGSALAREELQRLVARVVEHHGGDPYRARHHRRLLAEAGFARPVAGATLGTAGFWGTPEDTRFAAAWLSGQLRLPAFVEVVTARGWADQATLDAMVAAALAWGERSDAFLAVMGVTALGWVDG
jgi:hypothetical protein